MSSSQSSLTRAEVVIATSEASKRPLQSRVKASSTNSVRSWSSFFKRVLVLALMFSSLFSARNLRFTVYGLSLVNGQWSLVFGHSAFSIQCPELDVGRSMLDVQGVQGAASAADFKSARPFSNWLPTILSMFMKSPINLQIKLLFPNMLQVTIVLLPFGLNVNSAILVAAKGFRNSSLILINSTGRLSVRVMRPVPTCLLPLHE